MATSLVLFKVLYITAVLMGVVPYRFRLYPVTLETRTVLLYYCYLISCLSPVVRLGINLSWTWHITRNFSVMKVAAIIMEACEMMLLTFPILYVLSSPVKVRRLVEEMSKLHHSSVLSGRISVCAWLRKCFTFTVLYEVSYAVVVLIGTTLSKYYADWLLLPYVPCVVLSTLAKAIMLLLMYGAAQYLLIVTRTINTILLAINTRPVTEGVDSTQNQLPRVYDRLWKCCQCFNALFGLPIVCYLLLVFMQTTTVLYMTLSKFLLAKTERTLANRIVSVSEIVWIMIDSMYVLIGVIGTYSLIQDEVSSLN